MVTTTAEMTQLNLRVDGMEKRQAEDVLHLMGTTTTNVVRKLLAKVARGAKDYAEVIAVLDRPAEGLEQATEVSPVNPSVIEGWAIGDRYLESLECANAANTHNDTRLWEEVYEEAMTEKARGKGWLS